MGKAKPYSDTEKDLLRKIIVESGDNVDYDAVAQSLERPRRGVIQMVSTLRKEMNADLEIKTADELLEDARKRKKAELEELAEKKKLRQALLDYDDTQSFIEGLRDTIIPILADGWGVAKKVKPRKAKKTGSKEAANLQQSDEHCGELVRPEETLGAGRFNHEIFMAQMAGLYDAAFRITDRHRKAAPIDTLNVFRLGDNVHGDFSSGSWGYLHQEFGILQQMAVYLKAQRDALLAARNHYDQINVYSVPGNHGRIGKPGANHIYDNYDNMIALTLSMLFEDDAVINFAPPIETAIDIVEVMGVKLLLFHGHGIKSWGGIPFYGLIRAEAKLRGLIDATKSQDMVEARVKEMYPEAFEDGADVNPFRLIDCVRRVCRSFDYILGGHFHTGGNVPTNASEILINGSFPGGDNYSVQQLFSSARPMQRFFGIHDEQKLITWQYQLELNRLIDYGV